MDKLTLSEKTETAAPFKWRDRTGAFLELREMSTKHIFYTWLMIWNHAAPEALKIWNTHQYTFSDFYTPAYMLKAFTQLYRELNKRNDLGFKSGQVVTQIEKLYSIYKDPNKQKILSE